MPIGPIASQNWCAASTHQDYCGSPGTPRAWRGCKRVRGAAGVGRLPAARPAVDADAHWLATIVYGSQTGNGRRIAEALGERLVSRGLRVRVLRAGE